jgi:hypothetical protein
LLVEGVTKTTDRRRQRLAVRAVGAQLIHGKRQRVGAPIAVEEGLRLPIELVGNLAVGGARIGHAVPLPADGRRQTPGRPAATSSAES